MNEVRDLLLRTLENTNKSWTPVRHYPSSASFKYPDGRLIGPDLRMQFLSWTGVKPSNPPDGEALMKMKLGNGTHDTLAGIFAQAGIMVLSETPFRSRIPGLEHEVSGRSDFLAELRQGDLEVIEAKSSDDGTIFGNKYKPGIIKTGPKDDHKLQVICYLNCIPGVKRGRFLYIARDTGRMLEFVMERDGTDSYALDGVHVPDLNWKGIVERWAALESAVKSGVTPAPEYRAWLSPQTRKVMPVKTIDGVKYKTPWRVIYDSYRDATWLDPENAKYQLTPADVQGVSGESDE